MQTSIYDNQETVETYNSAVKAIDDAAAAQAQSNKVNVNKGSGIDAVRNYMVKDKMREEEKKSQPAWNPGRAARQAADNLWETYIIKARFVL